MGDELETREKLLESAMTEFSENGYMKASLRKICADADAGKSSTADYESGG